MSTTTETDSESRHFSLRRKRFAIVAGLATSLITGCVLGIPQQIGISKKITVNYNGRRESESFWTVVRAGWPLTYYVNDPNGKGVEIIYLGLYSNVVFCIFLTIGAGTGMGRIVWCARWPPQFSMRSIFYWTLVVATLLGVMPVYLELSGILHGGVPPYVPITALMALALALFAGAWTLLFLARWLLKLGKTSS